jgi:hypothetical protein
MAEVLSNKDRNVERARALKGCLTRNDILHQTELLIDAVPSMLSNLRSRANVTSIDGRIPIAVQYWLKYFSEGEFEGASSRPFATAGPKASRPQDFPPELAVEDQ